MNWEEIEKMLASGDARKCVRYGSCTVRATHQEGRAMMRYWLHDIPKTAFTQRIYDYTDEIVRHMKRIQPDSTLWQLG